MLIAGLITVLGVVLVHSVPHDWLIYFVVIALVSILFSALGLIFGLLADKFDHIAILTTFVITPLTFVGGVFTSAKMLPPAAADLRAFQSDLLYDRRLSTQLHRAELPRTGVLDWDGRASYRDFARHYLAPDGDRL